MGVVIGETTIIGMMFYYTRSSFGGTSLSKGKDPTIGDEVVVGSELK